MKKIIFNSLLFVLVLSATGQNVGIGTNTPAAKLHVVGSVRSTGLLTTDANLFVTGYTGLGIGENALYRLLVNGNSRFQGEGTFTGDLHTNLNLSATGNANIYGALWGQTVRSGSTLRADERAAIGGATDDNYRLRVYDGNTRLGGDAQVTGNMAVGGDLDALYRLRVYGGDARIGGEFHATGNVGIGNTPDASYKLRVYGGNSRFDGNATISGELSTNTLTIGGNGSVRSNGTSPLRIGFNQKTVDIGLNINEVVEVTANISDFTGDNDDVRVMICQFVHDPLGSNVAWERVGLSITAVNAANDTCVIRIHNRSGTGLQVKGTIYLMTVAKN